MYRHRVNVKVNVAKLDLLINSQSEKKLIALFRSKKVNRATYTSIMHKRRASIEMLERICTHYGVDWHDYIEREPIDYQHSYWWHDDNSFPVERQMCYRCIYGTSRNDKELFMKQHSCNYFSITEQLKPLDSVVVTETGNICKCFVEGQTNVTKVNQLYLDTSKAGLKRRRKKYIKRYKEDSE